MKKGIILAVITGAPPDVDVLEAAAVVSRIYDSHIEVLHPHLDPYRVLADLVDGINGLGVSDIICGIKQDIERRQALASSTFATWIGRHDIRLELQLGKSPADTTFTPTASWRQYEGTYDGAMTQYGRLADLIIVAQPSADGRKWQDRMVEAAIFDTGRPVLCVPHGAKGLSFKRVAIMWNGSLQAARAVGDAMPLLSACDNAIVLTGGANDGPDATELVERLVLRGIDARTRRISSHQSVTPEGLLVAINDMDCGITIMGGYGRSRMRELILGGVTRHMLAESKVPLLLSH